MAENSRQKLIKKLTSKYRLIIMNDDTFEEVSSFRLSRINVYVLLSTIFVILVFLTVSTIVFTPLKQYIPGYSDIGTRRKVMMLKIKADSLEKVIHQNEIFLDNIKEVINDSVPINKTDSVFNVAANKKYDSIQLKKPSPMETQLRNEIDSQENFQVDLNLTPYKTNVNHISDFYFFTPVKGFISNEFDAKKGNFGIDIITPENSPIAATLDGIVVFTGWTPEQGYLIAIQHSTNLISLYKHNSALLKKEGNFVKAGDAIAIVGSGRVQNSKTLLHFELWYNGIALNPKDYIIFN